MLALKMLLTLAGALLLTTAFGLPLYALWLRIKNARTTTDGTETVVEPEPIAWRMPVFLAMAACVPMLMASSIVVVPSGMGGVRISQIGGTIPGTLYPGVHFVTPLVDQVEFFDLRDHLFTAGLGTDGAKSAKSSLDVQSREGLNIGLGVTVRYRLDPNKLASAQAHLPQPADKQNCAPGRCECMARARSLLHSARDLFEQARRSACQSCRHHYTQAGRRRHRG